MISKGKLLRLLRVSQNIHQNDAAKRAGISPEYLCLIEKGKKHASNDVLNELAKVYGIPSMLLFWNEDDLKHTKGTKQKALVRAMSKIVDQLFALIIPRDNE